MNQFRVLRGILAMFCITFFSGCSSFSRDYQRALGQVTPSDHIEGPWQGTWTSDGGHSGGLKCLLSRDSNSASPGHPAAYRARFEATFWKIFTAHYDVILKGTDQPGTTYLQGDHNLGWIAGGVYHYDAQVTPSHFHATYRSSKDRGKFVLVRPGFAIE